MTPFSPQAEARIATFEAALRAGEAVAINQQLAGGPADEAQRLLHELAMLELEHGWQRAAADGTPGPRLETLLKRHPQLGGLDDLPLELVAEEYRARRASGELPTAAEYAARFPRHGHELLQTLLQVEAELRREGVLARREGTKARLAPPASTRTTEEAALDPARYKLKRLIGSGGMCRVYTGVDAATQTPVAVKVLKKELLRDERCVARFWGEVQTLERCRHPQVVAVHGRGRYPTGGCFIVLDLIEGYDLSRRKPRPVPAEVARLVADAAEVVEHCHRQGIVHCDLKPSNLLCDLRGRVIVSDFGLARPLADAAAALPWDEDVVAGTAAFMAPEQFDAGVGPIDARTDVYGLGGVLYTLWKGVPFDRSRGELAAEESPLAAICRRALAWRPADRYTSAAALATALRAIDAPRD